MANNEKNKQKVEVPTQENGQVGIRATLNNYGISNDRIGYRESDGAVTLDNQTLMMPAYLDADAGVSYATQEDIQKSLTNFFSGSADPIVKVSDYVTKTLSPYGISADALSYSNGTVSLGGKPMNVLYTDDSGKAWAWESQVKKSTEDYLDGINAQSPTDLSELLTKTYLQKLETRIDDISNREEFSYDPETDPVYQAYQSRYQREGQRAAEEAMASYAALTGGYTNSAAATAGAQAYQYYMGQLTDVIPELANQAYTRYLDEVETELSVLDSMTDLYTTAYEHAMAANAAELEHINQSVLSNKERDVRNRQSNWEDLFSEQEYEQNAQDMKWAEELNSQTAEKNLWNNYLLSLDAAYYEDMLQAEVAKQQADTDRTKAQTYQIYYKLK